MTEARFYHLTLSSLEQALPQLLEKVIERGARAVVMTGSLERTEALTQHLWTYNDRGFLPHGNAKDGHAAAQPIWLTDKDENPNNATMLFLTDGAVTENAAQYELLCEFFDGNSAEAVDHSRARWKQYKDTGFTLAYFQQNENGGWESKK